MTKITLHTQLEVTSRLVCHALLEILYLAEASYNILKILYLAKASYYISQIALRSRVPLAICTKSYLRTQLHFIGIG